MDSRNTAVWAEPNEETLLALTIPINSMEPNMPLYLLRTITPQPPKVGSIPADGREPAIPDGENRSAACCSAQVRTETILGLAEESGHEVGAFGREAGVGRELEGVFPVEAGEGQRRVG
jgi:hypothetical protein